MISSRSDLTFKHNLRRGRHGWLRLTPAYSVKVVEELLGQGRTPRLVLDPFSGSGTTGLVCAERGIDCHLAELNPFLVWLARAKTRNYEPSGLQAARELAHTVVDESRALDGAGALWVPPLRNIERWWSPERLTALARLFHGLRRRRGEGSRSTELDLLLIAFCQVALSWSSAAFNHQSMSFNNQPMLLVPDGSDLINDNFLSLVERMIESARPSLGGTVTVYGGDSRTIHQITPGPYDRVITSPPYPNRMSYIRELRPHMYWLGFISDARQAADLDWEAIGGTWGVATSRLTRWTHEDMLVPHDGFDKIIKSIAGKSVLLANYVRKYFIDISMHLSNIRKVLAPGARASYIVGNSKFYDVVVPVEQIYASIMKWLGLQNITIDILRKRNSKKELLEFVISADWL